ncbi:MAG TPA: aldolase [Steroidobacteraceae bacterium]|nr:aldolase [Steroidobacteraceae bacterium]
MNVSADAAWSRGDARRQARIDLAACHRLAARFGLNEGIDNHLTMMVPGYDDRFYLAPFGLLWSEVKASDLMELDFSGKVVAGRGLVEDTALHIHLPLHRRVRAARCVLHTHMPYATALSMLEDARLEMAGQSAIGFHGEIGYYDYNGFALDDAEGERMAVALGEKCVLMLRNHGVLVIGNSAAQAFERLYFLERASQAQILALSSGRPLRILPQPVVDATVAQFHACTEVAGVSRTELHFAALKRLLDRSEADYVR